MKQLKKTALHGDLFCVPAIDKTEKHGFVIGRFIETTPENLGYLIEIFKKFYVTPPSSLKDVDRSERLFRPILTSLSFVNIPRWHVILHDPEYEKSQSEYNKIGFALIQCYGLAEKMFHYQEIATSFTNRPRTGLRSRLFGERVYI